MSENMNEGFLITMEDPALVTVPIDADLELEGAAADAAAVGAALALKANIADIVGVSVNGEEADNQGVILIDGSIIPISDAEGAPMISAAMEQALATKTAADIPMSSEEGADSVAEAIEAIQEGAAGCVKSVNGNEPDENGNVQLTEVQAAQNLTSDSSQAVAGAFVLRTAGGNRSVKSGPAQIQEIRGMMEHTDKVPEVLTYDVVGDGITAQLDRATWVAAVSNSGTYEFSYNGSAWKLNGDTVTPGDYGITITGTATNGDTITVDYTKEDRGVITPATPEKLVATGWNLYNAATGYARVKKYAHKYHIGGDYTGLQFSETANGARTTITVDAGGTFDVPSDGYVWPSGASAANTYVTTEWTDWTTGPSVAFEGYTESEIDLTDVMTSEFPDGLFAVGTVYDEINLANSQAISRIERLAYDPLTLEAIIAQGRAYDADRDYIYAVKTSFSPVSISISNQYQENDHGLEMFTGTEVGPYTIILYGQDLKAKLVSDTLTWSKQDGSEEQKAQARENIGAQEAMTFSDITETGWTWGNAYTTGDNPTVSFLALGRFRMLRLTIAPKNTATTWAVIGTVAEGHRPPQNISTYAVESAGSPNPKHIRLKPDGSCEIFKKDVSTYSVNMMWFV